MSSEIYECEFAQAELEGIFKDSWGEIPTT